MPKRKFSWLSAVYLCLTAGAGIWSASVPAQSGIRTQATKTANVTGKREVKFEVISIRPAKPGLSPYDGGATHMADSNPTPDGFISTLTVWQMLMIAYSPDDGSAQTVPMVNAPKWMSENPAEWYVINARVSDADRDAWRGQNKGHALLHSAMRDLLKQRCKLAAQVQPAEFPDYKLVIGKKGLKMKGTAPGSIPPKGAFALPTGGFRVATGPREKPAWHYYGATIGELIDFLRPRGTYSSAPPIRDETGLTGRYDFTLVMVDDPSSDRDETIDKWPIGPLGLELKPGKYPGYKLVIEHIERPTAN